MTKRGFSLVELLVVIGIIAVLSAVLLVSFSGATDSARAAKCLSNMRSLAQAVNSYAMEENTYPYAGSFETIGSDPETHRPAYMSQPGWISWLCKGNYDSVKGSSSHRSNPIAPYYGTGNDDDALFALTNGTLWVSCAKNRSLYVCPLHSRYCTEHGKAQPVWSYVMNAKFGWDYEKGSKPIALEGMMYGALSRADRTLLFAELPTIDPTTGNDVSEKHSGLTADCVLQYQDVKSAKGSTGLYSSSSGEAESIGVVHTIGKGMPCAHIVFADGHTEKLAWRNGGDDVKRLTAYLCRGWDVTFSSKNGWKLAPDADQIED